MKNKKGLSDSIALTLGLIMIFCLIIDLIYSNNDNKPSDLARDLCEKYDGSYSSVSSTCKIPTGDFMIKYDIDYIDNKPYFISP